MDGQQPITIFGRVSRGDGGPLPGAALTLCDLAGDQLDRAAALDALQSVTAASEEFRGKTLAEQ